MKSSRKAAPPNGATGDPNPQEINTLVALFNQGCYTEMEALAREMTVRFPKHGFGWKAVGTALLQQGRTAEALVPLQKATELSQGDAQPYNNLGNIFLKLGRLSEAEASYRRALELNPSFVEAYHNLGNTLMNLGRLLEAETSYRQALELKPDFAEIHNNLGNTLQEQGRLSEAEASYRRALEIKPDYVEAYNNLGNTLLKLGRLSEAEASYRRALEIKPGYVEAYSNLGNILNKQGRLSEAEDSLRRALDIKPDFVKAHNNLGNTLLILGRLPEAEASYRRALEINPNYVEAYSNLGNILLTLGRHSEAEASYRRALEIKPNFIEALNNLALILNAQGEPMKALNLIKVSLKTDERLEAKKIFVDCVKRLRFMHDNSDVRNILVRALTEPWCRPDELARTGASLVKLNRDIGKCVTRATKAWPQRLPAQNLFGSTGFAAVATDRLLCALLDSTPICDIELERFLTMARQAMLDAATGIISSDDKSDTALSFYGALARQCFINEYVYALTDEETDQAQTLRDSLAVALEAEKPIPALWPVTVAAYFPLHSIPLAERLMGRSWPDAVTAVLIQQIREPEEERQYRTTMPRLTTIENEVSLLVQNQYEENPYPRWVKAAPVGKPVPIDEALHQHFHLTTFQPFGNGNAPDILIAGCGTGQQSIEMAQQFQGARVLAVDLSLTSLCYAKRKTQELGLTTIEYAQADILKLESFDRRFDVIAASGVLHHLADPMAGWKILLSLLRPGGFMYLGFYSDVALQDIIRERTFIAERGYASTAKDIRQCRQELMGFGKSAGFGTALKFGDFFSVSECRDLLFHVQEYHMKLADINVFLQDNKLQFLGFEIETDVLKAYRLRFPDDLAATNLAHWQVFEVENPDAFIGMYQFWVQKAG